MQVDSPVMMGTNGLNFCIGYSPGLGRCCVNTAAVQQVMASDNDIGYSFNGQLTYTDTADEHANNGSNWTCSVVRNLNASCEDFSNVQMVGGISISLR